MEFKIDKSLLSEAISSLNPYLEKKDAKSIASNIMVKVDNCVLNMYATDYEFGLSIDIVNVIDATDGNFLVNGTNFLNVIKRLKSGEVHISLVKDNITIKQGKTKLNLEVLPVDTYPTYKIDESNMKSIKLNDSEVINGIKKTLFSIDQNNPKYELQCTLFDFDDTLKIVTTDTRTLSMYDTKLKFDESLQLLIPKKSIVEIQKILDNKCTILFNNTYLVIRNKDLVFHTKLVNGKFPAYQRVIPTESKFTFNIPTSDIIDSIKLITALENTIKLTFKDNIIKLESDSDKNKSETEIVLDDSVNEEVTIKANATNLINALLNVDSDKFTMSINSHNLPITLDSNSFKVINMPIVDRD